MHTKFRSENVNGRAHAEGQGIDRRILLDIVD
jgi:hypothetical protein